MLTLRLYQIDAFTRHVFAGNPAAVCPLESWLDDRTLQAIAQENNLSETAFFASEGDAFRLRWFTPVKEVSLCGHATLATAFVVFSELGWPQETVRFTTQSGPLTVQRAGERLAMDFPAKRLVPCADPPAALLQGLGRAPLGAFAVTPGRSFVALYEDEAVLRAIVPDFARLAQLGGGIGVTAPGQDVDCVTRYFAPNHGVPEDPVTGSIHCSLVPYWAQRLGKSQIYTRQVSARGGDLYCEDRGERVIIAGYAVKYMEGVVRV